LVGLIVGFIVTNQINRNGYSQIATSAASVQTTNNPGQGSQPPQVSNQVVKDQSGTGGMLPQVQQTLERAKNEPNNLEAQITAGDMYSRIQNFEKAIEFYQRANQLKPDDYDTLVKLGNSHFDTGKFESAEKWYSAALAKNPNDIAVRTDLGATFVERQSPDYDRAIKEFRTSLEKDPRHPQSLHNLAVALKRKGETTELPEVLNRLEQVNPGDPIIASYRRDLSK
jgi:tetratricopeptide (TPR) repeat protein